MEDTTTTENPGTAWLKRIQSCADPESLKKEGEAVAEEMRQKIADKEFCDGMAVLHVRNAYINHPQNMSGKGHDLWQPIIESTKGDTPT